MSVADKAWAAMDAAELVSRLREMDATCARNNGLHTTATALCGIFRTCADRVEALTAQLEEAKEDGAESAVMLSQLNDEHCALQASHAALTAHYEQGQQEIQKLMRELGSLRSSTALASAGKDESHS